MRWIIAFLLAVTPAFAQPYGPSPIGGGTGNVTGPGSSTTNDCALFADTTGKVLKDGACGGGTGNVAVAALAKGDTNYTIVASDFAAGTTDFLVYTNASFTAPRTWTLPAANTVAAGHTISANDVAGAIGGANILTIARAGSDTIGGATTLTVNGQYGSVTLISDGVSKWSVAAGRTAAAFAAVAHQFLTGCNATGCTAAQPVYSDLGNLSSDTVIGNPTSVTAAPQETSSPVIGTIGLAGITSGVITIRPQNVAGTYTMTLPTANASGVLTNDGAGALSWAAASGTGTVTSVATGCGLTGGTITTTGTLAVTKTTTIKTDNYTVLTTDCGGLLVMNAATAKTFTLLAPATAGAGYGENFYNAGAGVLTLSPAAGQINGASSMTLTSGMGVVCSTDGSDYYCPRSWTASTIVTDYTSSGSFTINPLTKTVNIFGCGGGGGGAGGNGATAAGNPGGEGYCPVVPVTKTAAEVGSSAVTVTVGQGGGGGAAAATGTDGTATCFGGTCSTSKGAGNIAYFGGGGGGNNAGAVNSTGSPGTPYISPHLNGLTSTGDLANGLPASAGSVVLQGFATSGTGTSRAGISTELGAGEGGWGGDTTPQAGGAGSLGPGCSAKATAGTSGGGAGGDAALDHAGDLIPGCGGAGGGGTNTATAGGKGGNGINGGGGGGGGSSGSGTNGAGGNGGNGYIRVVEHL